MKKILVLIPLLTAFFIISTISTASEVSVTVWVKSVLGVSVWGDENPVICEKGKECGTWLTIQNEGNIRDKLRLTASAPGDCGDHLVYEFECAETVGECEGKEVNNMILTPSISKTKAYLRIMPLASKSVIEDDCQPKNPKINILGYSTTKKTFNPDFYEVNITMQSSGDGILSDPLETPGLGIEGLIFLFISSILIYGFLIKYR